MAAARPTPDGAPSPRVDGGPAHGGKPPTAPRLRAWMAGRRVEERLTTRRGDGGDGRSGAAAAGSGLPAVGSGASMTDLAGASPRATTMGAEGGGGGWRLAAAGEGGRHVWRTQW
uniref:DUF834 domain-containing protein n=1 Tax=Oryza rufipogon TaxID=4529 RepID=A0A0E0MX28_ORYRU